MIRYSSRLWLYAPTLFVLLLAAGLSLHWWTAADAFEKNLAALKGRQAIPGVTLDWASVRVGGFPFRMDADFTGFQIHGEGARGPFSWSSEKFALHRLSYGRAKIVYEAAGHQQVHWTGADGSTHAATFLPGSMHGSSIMGAQGLARFDIDIVDMGDKAFTAGRFQFHIRRDPDGKALDLMLRVDTARGFGAPQKLIQAYATLSRADVLLPLLRGEAPLPGAVAAWHAQGGSAKLSQTTAEQQAAAILWVLY